MVYSTERPVYILNKSVQYKLNIHLQYIQTVYSLNNRVQYR